MLSVSAFAETSDDDVRLLAEPDTKAKVLLRKPGANAPVRKKRFPVLTTKEQKQRYLVDVCRRIEIASKRHDLPPGFLARLLWQESRFNANAVSPKGAAGIAQFMPKTAEERGLKNPFDPVQAIPASASYLSDLLKELGNLGLAAAGYNAGPNRVAAWRAGKRGLPLETRDFVRIITGFSAEDWASEVHPKVDFVLRKGVPFLEACSEYRIKAPVIVASNEVGEWRPWGVHLIAHRNRAKALSIYREIQREQPRLLKDVVPMVLIVRRHSIGRKPRYAVRVGKNTQDEAIDFCNKLRRSGGACIVYKTRR